MKAVSRTAIAALLAATALLAVPNAAGASNHSDDFNDWKGNEVRIDTVCSGTDHVITSYRVGEYKIQLDGGVPKLVAFFDRDGLDGIEGSDALFAAEQVNGQWQFEAHGNVWRLSSDERSFQTDAGHRVPIAENRDICRLPLAPSNDPFGSVYKYDRHGQYYEPTDNDEAQRRAREWNKQRPSGADPLPETNTGLCDHFGLTGSGYELAGGYAC